ncbi:MAG: ABC transporter permease [Bauldia sp.]|uniref:ABC transporter permease n=1 Tax=Bauldia sp. TaxID=2575872 RepID=UPI001E0CF1CB|nr:ABC transporter permease [Bauldia sp.]MCB1494765.1 ABC transporter permease [Bauldia sp.]
MNAIDRFRRRFAYAGPAIATALVLLAINILLDPSFLDPTNWPSILAVAMPFILIAMAAAPAIVSGGGGIDLSIGPLAGFVNAVLIGSLFPAGITTPLLVIPATLLIGAGVGTANGFLVSVVRVPPIIATLGTYLVLTGATLVVLPMAGGRAPDWIIALGQGFGGFPMPLLILAVVALLWLPVRQSAFGRNLLATGGDQRSAFASGINVTAVRFLVYVFGGVVAAMTGFAFTVSLGSGDPTAAGPYTLIGIAGAVLGGTSLAGGRGGLLGAAAGGSVLFLMQNLLSLAHVSAFYAQFTYGLILVLALAINGAVNSRRRRRERAAISELHEATTVR